MPTKKTATPKKTYLNNDLPIVYVDGISIGHRDDGINYVSLTSNIPDCTVEQVRFMIGDEHLPRIIDALCRAIDYFPKKPSKKRRRQSK